MIFSSWSEFFAMGGYANFVWGSYGVVAVALMVEMLMLRSRRRQAQEAAHLAAKLAARPGGRAVGDSVGGGAALAAAKSKSNPAEAA